MIVLKKPIVTEKFAALNEKGVYGFIVDGKANKIEIKKAVKEMFGVNVESVRTIRYAGKVKTKYSKSKVVSGKTASFKKAIIKVAQGEVIDFYSGI